MNSRAEALVLRRTNYGEADRIIQVITPDGKRSLMAKGVRKEKSKLAGGIEVFSLSDITWRVGRSELGVLTSARLVKFYKNILEDYDRLQFGYEALRQVAKKSEMIDSPDFFELLKSILQALNSTDYELALVQSWFYLRLSQVIGEGLNLNTDVNGEKLREDAKYLYDVEQEALVESVSGNIVSDHIKLLRIMQMNDIGVVRKVTGVESLLSETLHLAQIAARL